MANVVIWGGGRDLVAGELPSGLNVERVTSASEVRSRASRDGSVVLIAGDALAEADEALRDWRTSTGGGVQLVAVTSQEDAEDALVEHDFLDDVFVAPVAPVRLRKHLERAIETANARRMASQLERALARKREELQGLNEIGVALSAERDIDALLALILTKSREITAADAGSLYLVKEGDESQLQFTMAQNDSVVIPFKARSLPLDEKSIAGYVCVTGHPVNAQDVYELPPDSPYQASGGAARSFDERSGYRTKSMLVVPMRDHENKVIGAVQLINKKRDASALLQPVSLVDEMVIPFTGVDEELVSSLASQAAVALENTRLIENIRQLFDSFVNASVKAIESRDPTTSGHSDRVAQLTVAIAEKVDGLASGPFKDVSFTRDQVQEIRYASLLHDFGKVGVREKVLIKGKKLFVGEMLSLRQRFAYIKKSLEAEHLRDKLDRLREGRLTAEYEKESDQSQMERQAETDRILSMILKANEPTILEEESFRALMDLPERTFTDIEGQPQPYLTTNEVEALSIRKGSLSEKERREIESHVTHTFHFLERIPWTGEFAAVPEIAYAHHEKLDGTGYPRGLAADKIPIQSRMMTISDIYDALVAWDRPYKKAVPVPRALKILEEEAGAGKLDASLLTLFIDAKLYELTLPPEGTAPAR